VIEHAPDQLDALFPVIHDQYSGIENAGGSNQWLVLQGLSYEISAGKSDVIHFAGNGTGFKEALNKYSLSALLIKSG
jgi:hypothetical protein